MDNELVENTVELIKLLNKIRWLYRHLRALYFYMKKSDDHMKDSTTDLAPGIHMHLLEKCVKMNGEHFDLSSVMLWAKEHGFISEDEFQLHQEKLKKPKTALGFRLSHKLGVIKRFCDHNLEVVDANGGYLLRPAYLYKYLDYVELKEARIQAVVAKRHSNVAISIAVLSVVLLGILGYFQLVTPVDLSEGSIKQLEDAVSGQQPMVIEVLTATNDTTFQDTPK